LPSSGYIEKQNSSSCLSGPFSAKCITTLLCIDSFDCEKFGQKLLSVV